MHPEITSPTWATICAQYNEALRWLDSLISDPRGERYLTAQTQEEIRSSQEAQVPRLARFLAYTGNPQESYHTVHVAGTGGKGSVANMVDAVLGASGLKSGLHTSPYLQIPNEKLIAGGEMVSPSTFTGLVAQLRTLYESYAQSWPEDRPKYGEAWIALAHLFFRQAGIDWLSLETGMGGRYDPTNAINSDLAIITNIDFDHVPRLGTTLPEIAWHKAGIIKPGKPVVTGETKAEASGVIEEEAAFKGSPLYRIERDYGVKNIKHGTQGITADVWTPFGPLDNLSISLIGEYQATNAATAITACLVLRDRHGLHIEEGAIREVMQRLRIAGRMEIMQQEPLVIIDAAHNPQKMRAAATTLRQDYLGRQKTLIIGMLKTKDVATSLHEALPLANRVIATEPHVVGKPSVTAAEMARMVSEIQPQVHVETEPDVQVAIRNALVAAAKDELIFVTGSIYMLGQARELWYPREELLRELEEGHHAPAG